MRNLRSLITNFGWLRVGTIFIAAAVAAATWSSVGLHSGSAQARAESAQSSIFRPGEKLTYNVSFGKFSNAAFVEFHVVSRGTLGKNDAVEIRSKIKTLELVSAAFFQVDDSRVVYADPATGLPIYLTKISNEGPVPKETVQNYLNQPTSNFDLVTLLYKARETGGTGAFPLFENEQLYTVGFLAAGLEKVKTDAGEFDTTISTVQSEFLTANGIRDLRINFSTDEYRVPVLIRFKTAKGDFRIAISSIQLPEPQAPLLPSPTPTPVSISTPKPTPTPEAYVDNKPLAPELGFKIGELLEYRITMGGRPTAVIALNAKERGLMEKDDTLLLTATITSVEPGNRLFTLRNALSAFVDPETLAPRISQGKFGGELKFLEQSVTFDKRTGGISVGGAPAFDAPIGTHSILSLIYAMRSFNLKPSKDPLNPVNDTRVAVFWETQTYVFTLRPSETSEIDVNGVKTPAQQITVKTGNPQLDALDIKVWLSNEESRVPLRFLFGQYQADLISQSSNLPK